MVKSAAEPFVIGQKYRVTWHGWNKKVCWFVGVYVGLNYLDHPAFSTNPETVPSDVASYDALCDAGLLAMPNGADGKPLPYEFVRVPEDTPCSPTQQGAENKTS